MTSGAPPAWLRAPLASPEILNAVCARLNDREHKRRQIASQLRQLVESGRALAQDHPATRYAVNDGVDPANVTKNRYSDIVAYERTQFQLAPALDDTSPLYVNASLVREPDLGFDQNQIPRRWWVASQAPIASTRYDFLSMFLQVPSSRHAQESPETAPQDRMRLIVQLTPLVEQGRAKGHPYFPREVGKVECIESTIHGADDIWIRLDGKTEDNGIRTSNLTMARGKTDACLRDNATELYHVEYRGWGDHGVPNDPLHLVKFIRDIQALNQSLARDEARPPPILVGCSAGVGRTGTFITVASLLPLLSLPLDSSPSPNLPPAEPDHPLGAYPTAELERLGVKPHDYVGLTIDGLREQRTTMVQTESQIKFCFLALKAAWDEEHRRR